MYEARRESQSCRGRLLAKDLKRTMRPGREPAEVAERPRLQLLTNDRVERRDHLVTVGSSRPPPSPQVATANARMPPAPRSLDPRTIESQQARKPRPA